jgi:hypothetical protein
MATHEPEIREPVDLCLPDGRRLNPAARGWSRRPLHRANLAGAWGRTKRWDWWGVLAGELTLSVVYADVDYIGIAGVWWADLAKGTSGGRDTIVPLARGLRLPENPGTAPLHYRASGMELDLVDDAGGTTLRARWREKDGTPGELEARVTQPEGHESLNVVIPWSDTRFQYTSKHQARPAQGVLRVGDASRSFGGDEAEAWGVLDVGRGRWPYRTRWNWGGGAGRLADGRSFGLQIGGKWTDGTGFTENGMIVDGRLEKLGDELVWDYDWDAPLRPWKVRTPDGRLDLTLEPVYDKHSRTEMLILGTEVHQAFGRWSGSFTREDGETLEIQDLQGFAEESRSRW